MDRSKEQQAHLDDFDKKSQEITLDTLWRLYRKIDILFGTPVKTDDEYMNEAILHLAVARANQAAAR